MIFFNESLSPSMSPDAVAVGERDDEGEAVGDVLEVGVGDFDGVGLGVELGGGVVGVDVGTLVGVGLGVIVGTVRAIVIAVKFASEEV